MTAHLSHHRTRLEKLLHDNAAATVDRPLAGASDSYRAANRDEMIRKHLPWARFEFRQREADACKAVAACARMIRQAAWHREHGKMGVAA